MFLFTDVKRAKTYIKLKLSFHESDKIFYNPHRFPFWCRSRAKMVTIYLKLCVGRAAQHHATFEGHEPFDKFMILNLIILTVALTQLLRRLKSCFILSMGK